MQRAGSADRQGTAPADLLAATASAPAASHLDADTLQVWVTPRHSYRGVLLELKGANALVAVAMDFHLDYVARLRRALWWGTLLAFAVALAAVWLAVRWGHAPLRRISATVRGIGSEQLHLRLDDTQVPIELTHLVASFNLMLDQLQASFERLSHFSADIAHELRTPVTNLTTQTQVALSKPRPAAAYQEVLYLNLEELERMGRMIGDMLFLAQADHRLVRPGQVEVDLAAEVQALFDYFEALAEEQGIGLALTGTAPAVRGDPLMLRRALSNLISNALHHTPSGQAVTVRLTEQPGGVEVQVENTGPDIAPEHLPRLFDRFYRVDPARQHRSAGSGLGLALVKSIAEAHGGSVGVSSVRGLTCFTLRLPLAQATA